MTEPPVAKRGKTVQSIMFLNSTRPLLSQPLRSASTAPSTSTSTAWEGVLQQQQQQHLTVLPEDVLCRITCFLDAKSLLQLGACNRYYYALCQQNRAGWENLCVSIWATKVHVCPAARALLASSMDVGGLTNGKKMSTFTPASNRTTALTAYQMAKQDASQRQHVAIHEFCYDPATGEGPVWSFRFKQSAGADWTVIDP
jgi:hypothetical protein